MEKFGTTFNNQAYVCNVSTTALTLSCDPVSSLPGNLPLLICSVGTTGSYSCNFSSPGSLQPLTPSNSGGNVRLGIMTVIIIVVLIILLAIVFIVAANSRSTEIIEVPAKVGN